MVEQLVHDWGYLAVALGTFAEGETILLAAGYAAHHGLLDLRVLIAVAVVCATAGDQFFFWIGRRWGEQLLLRRFPGLASHVDAVGSLLRRYPHGAVIAVRFLYGLRIAGPILIGAAGVPPGTFALYNFIGALLWAPLIAGLGWGFGAGLDALSARIQHAEFGVLALVAAGVVGWLLWRRLRRSKASPRRPSDP